MYDEHNIGDVIVIDKKEKHCVEVVEQSSCYGCYFMYVCKHENKKTIEREYGFCSEMDRKDGKNVIFKIKY